MSKTTERKLKRLRLKYVESIREYDRCQRRAFVANRRCEELQKELNMLEASQLG